MLTVTATASGKSATTDHGWHLDSTHADMTVRFLRGSKMRSLEAAYNEMAAALQFPWYFGENIAALVDCLGDLSWLADNVTLIFFDSDEILTETPDVKSLFYDAIKHAEQAFSEDSNPLHPDRTAPAVFRIIFQCDESKLDQVMKDAALLTSDCKIITLSDLEASDA